jgi:hypothetical protein
MTNAIELFQAEHGGWIVKRHNPIDADMRILFAGSVEDCIAYVRKWMEEHQ